MKSISLLASLFMIGLASCGPSKNAPPNAPGETTVPPSMVEEEIVVPDDVQNALAQNTCLSCHKPDKKLIGPAYVDIAKKVSGVDEIIELIRAPKPERWPHYVPMNPVDISDEDGTLIAEWILSLK